MISAFQLDNTNKLPQIAREKKTEKSTTNIFKNLSIESEKKLRYICKGVKDFARALDSRNYQEASEGEEFDFLFALQRKDVDFENLQPH